MLITLGQCDEAKPECGNCVRFGVSCDFSPIPPQSLRDTPQPPKATRKGRPRSDWASWAEQIRLTSAGTSSRCAFSSKGLNVEDLELFYNYMMNTAGTMGDETGLWSQGVPRLGFQQPGILSLILALSSYQLARLQPLDSSRFLSLAEQHMTPALQSATGLLQHLSSENSSALYITAVLICFTAFAKGPSPGDLLIVSNDGQVPWLSLIRGVRLVVHTVGWSYIFSGVLAPCFPKPDEGRDKKAPSPSPLPPNEIEDWRSSLDGISDLIEVCSEQQLRQTYRHDLAELKGCCESTFGKGHHAGVNVDGQMQIVFHWIYQLEDSFVAGLTQKDPIALIILGHFCVLLRTLERYWFLEGWASHIMEEILKSSNASRKWLDWPVRYLKGHGTSALEPRNLDPQLGASV